MQEPEGWSGRTFLTGAQNSPSSKAVVPAQWSSLRKKAKRDDASRAEKFPGIINLNANHICTKRKLNIIVTGVAIPT